MQQHAWYVVAFGANQGDARAMLDEVAARWLALEGARSVWCSKLYASVPVGTHRASAYHNAVVFVESTLVEPAAFFAQMQRLETELGRRRTGHWSPRTVDLDLIFAGNAILDSADLIVPHPRVHFRRFVVQPIHDLYDDLLKREPQQFTMAPPFHPLLQSSLDDLLRRIDRGRVWLIADETRHADLIHHAEQALAKDRLTIIPQLAVASAFSMGGLVMRADLARATAPTITEAQQHSTNNPRDVHERAKRSSVPNAEHADWILLADPSLLHVIPSTANRQPASTDSARQVHATPPDDQVGSTQIDQKHDVHADAAQSTDAVAIISLPVVDLSQTSHFTAIQQFDFFLDSIAPIA